MGLFSFVGGLLGGGAAKKASKKAMQAQVDAYNKGIAEQQRQFDTTRADFEPYRQSGLNGLTGLNNLVGTNGADAQSAAIESLKASPFYQQLFDTGEEALLANASATGGIRGGNTQAGLADFGRDTLMQTIERQLASLGGLAGMGMGSTEAVANFGARKADNVTNLLSSIGGAKASNYLTRGGINAQMWNNAGSFLDQAAGAFAGGFGGGGGMAGGLSSLFKGMF